MNSLAADVGHEEILERLRSALIRETARYQNPLRDCVAKFNGQWRTGSEQFDAASAYLTDAAMHVGQEGSVSRGI
jgi:hypothetical protein